MNTSVAPTLRHEGLTELVGDIVLNCLNSGTGPTAPGQPIPQANVSVSLGATLSTSYTGNVGGLDALLLVDDPPPADQLVCASPTNGLLCPVTGDGGQTFKNPTKYNVFQGILGGPGTNSITFLGVPVDPAATGYRTYRITNVRIQGPSVPAGAFGLTPVYAFVSASPSTSISITQTSQPVVGFVSQGLNFTTSSTGTPFLQCVSVTDQTQVGSVTFMENFQTAFKTAGNTAGSQTTPGQVYYTESGLQVAVSGGTTGLATSATEFEAVISNIPSGVQVYVDTGAVDTVGGAACMILPTLSDCSDGIPGPTLLTDNESGGPATASAVWTVTAANALATDQFTFNVYVTFTGAPGAPGSPQTNVTAYAQGGFYPQEAAWANGGPVPEFIIGLSPAAPGQSLFVVSLCQTILLFPYITDFYGFDTGIAISNTSLDNLPVGASPQPGGCSVNFYGGGGAATAIGTSGVYSSSADASLTGGIINPGQTWAFSVSSIDPGYNSTPTYGTTGYAIATCDFQFAHGYSFVSDTGIRNFAAAYLALIIPDAPRSPNPFLCASGWSCTGQAGEQLVH
ncbi:MAG TPA: hypothetical protein VKR61_18045 [Bryobacteraceae bacterium]|nr:hypothetical protein [Bryobacteraceae bacterium]